MHFLNPTLVLPHLMNHSLLTEEDADYISSPKQSDEEKKERILCALAVQDADVVERLVECLARDSVYSNHRYIARKLRDAMDMKRKHPDVPLSTLRLGTPPRDSKESSPPSAPIKPRGAAQRNSIAKLLATKRNNVANLISRIETKKASQHQPTVTESHTSEQPAVTDKPFSHKEPVTTSLYNHPQSNPVNTVRHHINTNAVSRSTSQSSSPLSPPSTTTPQMHSSHIPHHPLSPSHNRPNPPSPASPTVSFSPSHTQPAPLSARPRPHPMSPKSPSPQLTYSPPHSISPHMTHAPSSHAYSVAMSHSHQHSTPNSPSVTSPPRPQPPPRATAPKLFQAPGIPQNPPDTERHASVSPTDLPTSPTSQHSTDSGRVSLRERETTSSLASLGESDIHSQRKSLPDLLSSSSPKKPFYPPSPSYTEKGVDELTPPEKYSPDNHVDDSIQTEDEIPVRHRQRAPRLAGLTARFYRHRRSASMSAYDARPFKRGEQLYASENRGRMERSGFYHYGQGKTDPATAKVRASVREGTEKLVKRRIDWLQERVQFTDCPEHIQFTSQTHYGEERELLYSGTLHKHGKARFVVLFTDYLLVLKARRPSVPSKLGGVFSFQQSSRIDWFSDLEYTAKKPLPLHLLTVQHQSSKQSNDNFCLHFNEKNKVMEIVLQAVSKEARDIWVEELSEAITQATSAHADTFVLVGNRAVIKKSCEPYKKLQLQIHSASSLGLAANCNSFSLFCVIELGKQRCRTPSVMGGYNPSWGYKCEFTDFDDEDNLLIEIFSENIFRPNDFLGCLNVPLTSLPEEQPGRKNFDGNMVLAGLEEAFAGELHITVEQGWETKM
jgi:hypothetical protein